MSSRIDYIKIAPEAVRHLFSLERYLHGCGLETTCCIWSNCALPN